MSARWDERLEVAKSIDLSKDSAIREIAYMYTGYIDSGHPELLENIMSEDVELEMPHFNVHAKGIKNVVAAYRPSQPPGPNTLRNVESRHQITSELVDISPDRKEAKNSSLYIATAIRGTSLQMWAGFYLFRLRKIRGLWKIVYYKIDRVFDIDIPGVNPRGAGLPPPGQTQPVTRAPGLI